MKPKRRKGGDGLYCAAEPDGTIHPFFKTGGIKEL